MDTLTKQAFERPKPFQKVKRNEKNSSRLSFSSTYVFILPAKMWQDRMVKWQMVDIKLLNAFNCSRFELDVLEHYISGSKRFITEKTLETATSITY